MQNSEGDTIAQRPKGDIGNLNRLERVSDSQDSGAEGNEFSSEAVGIPRAIPPFVVMRDEDRRPPQERKVLQQIRSEA